MNFSRSNKPKTKEELELLEKEVEIEIKRLEIRKFENEVKKEWLINYAMWTIIVFGIIAFLMQFCPDSQKTDPPLKYLPIVSEQIKSWGRNFLMVIIGGLLALLPTNKQK